MIRISKLADYAVVILSTMATRHKGLVSTSVLAESARLPEPTVSKVLKILVKAEIIESTRGINGGYTLKDLPTDITVERIVRAVDGPISITACSDGAEPDCSLLMTCSVRGRWDDVNAAIRGALEGVTLGDMINNSGEQKRVV